MKKRIICLTAVMFSVLICTAMLSACGKVDATEDLARVQESKVFKIGMECGYAPYNWTQFDDSNGAVPVHGVNGQYANGYDVSVAKKIALSLDAELEVYKMDFDALIPALKAGTIDAVIAGMSPTEKRRQEIDFSDPYFQSNLVVVVRKNGAYASADKLSDFSGAKIAAQRGTFHAEALAEIKTVTASDLYDNFPLMTTALLSGVIEGYIAEEPGAIADCLKKTELKYIALINNETGFSIDDIAESQLAVGLRKDSSLTRHIDTILSELSATEKQNLMNAAIANQPLGE